MNSICLCEPQNQLLGSEVAGVPWLHDEAPGGRDRERAADSNPEGDPQTDGSTQPKATLDLADPALVDADGVRDARLRQPPAATTIAQLRTDPCSNRSCFTVALEAGPVQPAAT